LIEYDDLVGLNWEWQSADGAMTEAPLGQESTGNNRTDRAEGGTKRSILKNANRIHLGVAIAGAIVLYLARNTPRFNKSLRDHR
jgi:putative transposase